VAVGELLYVLLALTFVIFCVYNPTKCLLVTYYPDMDFQMTWTLTNNSQTLSQQFLLISI